MWVRFPLAWFINTNRRFCLSNKFKLRNAQVVRGGGLIGRLKTREYIRYTLRFKTILPISTHLFDFKLQYSSLQVHNSLHKTTSSKLLIKQTYILLTWLFFLNVHLRKQIPAEITTTPVVQPAFFIFPRRTTVFTLTKAPMAHKTFSQEQYLFRFFSIGTTFVLPVTSSGDVVTTQATLYMLLLFKSTQFFFDTNLFFLQFIRIEVLSRDPIFLSI